MAGGLWQGLAALGAGVGRGEMAGTQYEFKARQAKEAQDYKNQLLALQSDKLQQAAKLAQDRIDQQQRQIFGRNAQQISRILQDPLQVANLNKFPGLTQKLQNDLNDSMAVATGQMDWRHVAPSQYVDPISGEVRLPPGVPGPFAGPNPGPVAPGAPGTPWQPQPGQPASENPYLDVRNQVAQQGQETRQQGTDQQGDYQKNLIRLGEQRNAMEGTKVNAGLMQQAFEDQLKLADSQLKQGNTTFGQQQQIWSRLIGMAAETAKAGADPARALKPFLFAHGMYGYTTPNETAIRDYLTQNGYDENTIRRVIAGSQPGGAASEGQAAGKPASAVMGSFQSTQGPPQLPVAGNVNFSTDAPHISDAQVQADAHGPIGPVNGGVGVVPIGASPAAPGQPGVGPAAAQLGVKTPATAPKVRSPYQEGSVEDRIFALYTGRNGRALDKDTIQEMFKGTPYYKKAAVIMRQANAQQKQGNFSGIPVAGENGAEWPNVPGFAAGQIDIPGASRFAPPGTTPVVNQGGFVGSFGGPGAPTAPPPPPPDMGPGGEVTLAPQPGPVQGPPIPTPETPQIDLGPWNQGPTRQFTPDQSIGMKPYGDRQMTPDQKIGPVPQSERGYSWGTGDTRLARIMSALMDSGPTSGMVSRIPGAAGETGALPPPPIHHAAPGLTAGNDPSVMPELNQLRGMPWAPAVEKFLQVNKITDPAQQRDYYAWVTQQLVPRMLNLPKMTQAQVLSMIFPILQKYARPQ